MVFHAVLTTKVRTRSERKLICKRMLINKGSGYSPETGVFTAPVAGTYMFLYSVKPAYDDKKAEVAIMINGEQKGYCRAEGIDDISTAFCAAHLDAGNTVWLETYGRSSSFDDWAFATSFCGILAQPDLRESEHYSMEQIVDWDEDDWTQPSEPGWG